MSHRYSTEIFVELSLAQTVVIAIPLLGLAVVAALASEAVENAGAHQSRRTTPIKTIETITFKDAQGVEHQEYAFREPAKGLPKHVMEMFCSSVRVRLYWSVFREEIKEAHRKGAYLRRMARLAKHLFEEVRDVDRPFNATMLSTVDEYFRADFDKSPPVDERDDESVRLDRAIESGASEQPHSSAPEYDVSAATDDNKAGLSRQFPVKSISFDQIKKKISNKWTKHSPGREEDSSSANSSSDLLDQIESNYIVKELDRQGHHKTTSKIRAFARKWDLKKISLTLYTRWRTMWWMTMSCLFTKYYLWDPALNEFNKIKRSLLMWPELQLAKLHELECKPLVFFRRIMDICKILNPLMRIDFGEFNLERMTRFKKDM